MANNLILAPLAGLLFLSKKLSKYLFARDIWKSVEFDMPVIAVSTLTDQDTPMEIIYLMDSLVRERSIETAVIPSRKQIRTSKIHLSENQKLNYVKSLAVENRQWYSTVHLALGISELAFTHDLGCVILGSEQFVGLIRAKARVLVIDCLNPFYKSDYWPMGDVVALKQDAQLADWVIVYNLSDQKDKPNVGHELKAVCKTNVEIAWIYQSEMDTMHDILSYNQADELVNIQDRDNFEKSLFRIIEKDH